MDRTRNRTENEAGASRGSSALPPPDGIDPDWRERIEIARNARDQARKMRANRPVTFDTNGVPIVYPYPPPPPRR